MPDTIRTDYALRNKKTKAVTHTFGTKDVMKTYLLRYKARFGVLPTNLEPVKLVTTVETVEL